MIAVFILIGVTAGDCVSPRHPSGQINVGTSLGAKRPILVDRITLANGTTSASWHHGVFIIRRRIGFLSLRSSLRHESPSFECRRCGRLSPPTTTKPSETRATLNAPTPFCIKPYCHHLRPYAPRRGGSDSHHPSTYSLSPSVEDRRHSCMSH